MGIQGVQDTLDAHHRVQVEWERVTQDMDPLSSECESEEGEDGEELGGPKEEDAGELLLGMYEKSSTDRFVQV